MRKIIAFAILSFASLFAILLIAGKNQLMPSVKNQTPPKFQTGEKPIVQKPIIRPQQNLTAANAGQAASALNQTEQADTHHDAEEILPNAIESENRPEISAILQNLEPEEIANQFFDQQFKNKVENLNYEKLKPVVNLKNLSVIHNPTKEDLENYLKNLQKILDEKSKIIRQQLKNLDENNFREFLVSYESLVQKLYQISVPENLADIHARGIALLITQQELYKLLKNYETDPFAALLAVEMQNNLTQDFFQLTQEINNFIVKNRLSI